MKIQKHTRLVTSLALAGLLVGGASAAQADGAGRSSCASLPSHGELKAALEAAQAVANGGFGLEMWATVVNRDGFVCAVAFTGGNRGDQWPGSRVISAQKANTANAFSLPGLSLSTANLYSAVQPGGSLFGLQESNPVSTAVAYGGHAGNYGRHNDPMVGERIGGVNVFGGGLGLYNSGGALVGGIGVSGDSSCADHNIAWRARNTLNLDFVPGGVSGDPSREDNVVYDITPQAGQMSGVSASGWGHPACSAAATAIAAALPATK
ncbi:MAG TPA: heme-binding protein [Vicinamibacterales bacterium]